jgi:hypothetical protein
MHNLNTFWHAPRLFDRFNWKSKVKTMEEQGVGACSLARNILGVEEHVGALRWDYKEWQAFNHSHGSAQTKQHVG